MTSPTRARALTLAVLSVLAGNLLHADALDDGFVTPPPEHRPETLFFLICGHFNESGFHKLFEGFSGAGVKGG